MTVPTDEPVPADPAWPVAGRRLPMAVPLAAWRVLWRFGRPHTLIGTTLSVGGLSVIAWASTGSGAGPGGLPALGLTWLAALAANLVIVGVNQITDVAIDRVNKPGLPLAAGTLGPETARHWVVLAAGTSLAAAAAVGPPLLATVVASMAIGAAYSLPPLRLKRHAAAAALCIAAVRGPLVNVGVYLALATAFAGAAVAGPLGVPAPVWALAAFVTIFSLGIALAKDIPDIAGDRRFGIRSLAVRMGPAATFRLARLTLTLAYGLVIALALAGLPGVNRPLLVAGHAVLAAWLWLATAHTDPARAADMGRAYTLVWRLFYAEYLLFPLACVLA